MKTDIVVSIKSYINWFAYLILISVCWSCASYKTRTFGEGKNWKKEEPAPGLKLKHRMYLVGDAGNSIEPKIVPVLKYLKEALSKESEHSSILFLGDNIYPSGMPPQVDPGDHISASGLRIAPNERKDAEYRLTTQLDVLEEFKGHPIFVPGNHDWKHGTVGVQEQQKFINNYLNAIRGTSKDYFLPKALSTGPVMVDLNDSIAAIIVDSHRLITLWDTLDSEGGTVGDRFKMDFNKIINDCQSKNIVVAMHHPPYTYGPHGGRYHLKQYAFPLSELEKDKWWSYVPAPSLGLVMLIPGVWSKIVGGVLALIPLLYPLERTYFFKSEQDVMNRKYQSYKNAMLAGTSNRANVSFVGGHEHTLQYLETNGHSFVVSGSGSKRNPVGLKRNISLFASSKVGYCVMDFYDRDETWVTYYNVSDDGSRAEPIFRRKVKNGKTL